MSDGMDLDSRKSHAFECDDNLVVSELRREGLFNAANDLKLIVT